MTTLALKILAIVFMFIDHLGFAIGSARFAEMNVSDMYWVCRSIGRLALPIFAFLIANGYRHTRNVKKYALRLFAFAIISEVPFDFFVSGGITLINPDGLVPSPMFDNVFFTLLIGLSFLCFNDFYKKKGLKYAKILSFATFVFLATFSAYISTDYGAVGVAWVALFGIFDIAEPKKQPFLFMGCAVLAYWRIIARAVVVVIYRVIGINIGAIPILTYFFSGNINTMALIQPVALLTFGLFLMYNGKNGMPENKTARKILQYAFYWFYPIHILVLYLIFK